MLRVNEIFHSIQGESTHAGRPCVFVRLAGCNLRCRWCDSAYAFFDGHEMAVDDVVRAVEGFRCPLVEITGGEPLLQPDARPLMRILRDRGYTVLLETGGSLPIQDVPEGVIRILDIKCPGSGEADRNLWENLEALGPRDEIKFVIADRDDYTWAARIVRDRALGDRSTVLFAPVHDGLAPGDLARWILDDRLPVRLQIQIHKVLWPGVLRGV